MAGTVNDLGNSINAANRSALTDMINLATAASGKSNIDLDSSTYTYMAAASGQQAGWYLGGTQDAAHKADSALSTKLTEAAGGSPTAGTSATSIEGVVVKVGDEIQAGGLVALQFKIDQMMAAVQEGIKNTGKVSQTREGAARA